jgi:hypothetical protein
MAIAVLTPNLPRLAIAGGAVFALQAAVLLAAFAIEMARYDPSEAQLVTRFGDRFAALATQIVTIVFAAAVIAHQYRTRRTRLSAALAASGFAAAQIAALFWPWAFLPQPQPHRAAGAADVSSLQVSIDPARTWIAGDHWARRGAAARKNVAAKLEVRGLSPGDFAAVAEVRSRIVYPDGGAVASRRTVEAVPREIDPSKPPEVTALEHLLAPNRVLGAENMRLDVWPVLASVEDEIFGRYRKQPGVCSAEVSLRLQRREIVLDPR